MLIRKESALAEKDRITPNDLAGQPLSVAKRPSVRNELENWFGQAAETFTGDGAFFGPFKILFKYFCIQINKNILSANVCLILEIDETATGICIRNAILTLFFI